MNKIGWIKPTQPIKMQNSSHSGTNLSSHKIKIHFDFLEFLISMNEPKWKQKKKIYEFVPQLTAKLISAQKLLFSISSHVSICIRIFDICTALMQNFVPFLAAAFK